MPQIDFARLPIVEDENHVDENGNPRNDAAIYPDKLICHPDMKEKLQQAKELFFKPKGGDYAEGVEDSNAD